VPSDGDFSRRLAEKVQGMSADDAHATIRNELIKRGRPEPDPRMLELYRKALTEDRPTAGIGIPVTRNAVAAAPHAPNGKYSGSDDSLAGNPNHAQQPGERARRDTHRRSAPRDTGTPSSLNRARVAYLCLWSVMRLGVGGVVVFFATRTHGILRVVLIVSGAVFIFIALVMFIWNLIKLRMIPRLSKEMESILTDAGTLARIPSGHRPALEREARSARLGGSRATSERFCPRVVLLVSALGRTHNSPHCRDAPGRAVLSGRWG
jgi:hypothetical protein